MEDVMRRAFGCVLCTVLAFSDCPAGMAQEPAANPGWETCLQAPTRACILDEALVHALAIEPSGNRTAQLGTIAMIAEAQAAAGNVEAALHIAQSIPSDRTLRITPLRAIASAQARLGVAGDAKETFIQARQLADSLPTQLGRAEVLLSLAQAEAEAGLMAEATKAFAESLNLAESPEILAGSSCILSRPAENRLDTLLQRLAEQQARAGTLSNALRAARSIKYVLSAKAEALRAIAEIQAQSGRQDEAGVILKEAVEALSQKPIEYLPSCPKARQVALPSWGMLSEVAKAQAKVGTNEDAAATFEKALQVIPAIEDDPVVKADTSGTLEYLKANVAKIKALSAVAVAQNEADFQAQSEATLERAMQAAADLSDARSRVTALISLGRAQYQVGRAAEAAGTFHDAWELARVRDDTLMLLNVLDGEVETGLTTEAEAILVQDLETARSIGDESRRAFFLNRIASSQEKMRRHEGAVATYREALKAADAIPNASTRGNVLFGLIQGALFGLRTARLIAESAPQVARIALSIEGEQRRSSALVVIASALPN
jgi:tetratricopeptide (TPR) repeat protein